MSTLTVTGGDLQFERTSGQSGQSEGLFRRFFKAFAKSREAHARQLVADAMHQFTDEQLKGLGYAEADILRLRNIKSV